MNIKVVPQQQDATRWRQSNTFKNKPKLKSVVSQWLQSSLLVTSAQESISQVRPLVISRNGADTQTEAGPEAHTCGWAPPLAPPLVVLLLALAAAIASFLLPWVRT